MSLLEDYFLQIRRLRQWLENTLPYGEPSLFGLVAFIVTTCLLLFLVNILSLVSPTTHLPVWIQATPYVVGVFAGYTGWKYAEL
jgi:hypothetical protein